jgi:hypothetical protein
LEFSSDERYHAKGARKLSTNLNYLFNIARIANFATKKIERWWVDAIFLALDRIVETRMIRGDKIDENRYERYLAAAGFHQISGKRSIEKDLAASHIANLFIASGGRGRFNEDAVRERTATLLPDVEKWIANDPEPVAAIHLTNPHIIKTIPRPCAMLAKSVGFQIFEVSDLAELNIADIVRSNLEKALADLRDEGIEPTMSAEDLIKMMRGR